ncbi:MAG: CBS domain-containing protein [Candidatus Saccharibacteria bacterium]|nr:CBS domain-containing protein [Candidatus Saccharibacteria bacterium]
MDTETSSNLLDLAIFIISFSLAIHLMQLIKSFSYMNLNELRRRALKGSRQARQVLKAREHGLRLWFVLWILLALVIVIMIQVLGNLIESTYLVILISIVLLTSLVFALPWAKWPVPSLVSAARVSGFLGKFLDRMELFFRIFKPLGLSQRISADKPLHIHSKEDLIDIIKELRDRINNPQAQTDLDLTIATLTFYSKKIINYMIPLADMRVVAPDQSLSLSFLKDLHQTGLSIFPVQNQSTEDFVGVLHYKDIEASDKENHKIAQVMRSSIYYVHEQSALDQVLNAFFVTEEYLFLVINDGQKVVGSITVFDVLKQYLGQQKLENLPNYNDAQDIVNSLENQAKTSNVKTNDAPDSN